MDDDSIDRIIAKAFPRVGPVGSFSQKGGDANCHGGSGERSDTAPPSGANSQAPRRPAYAARHDRPLHHGQGGTRAGEWVGRRDRSDQVKRVPHLGCLYQKASRWPTTPEEKAAPQHAKKVVPWDNARLRTLAKGHELEPVLDKQLKWNEDGSLYASIDAEPRRHCVSNVLQKHLDQQEEIGLIRKCDKHLIKRFGKAMHTYEPATADRGHRLRPLLHPQDVNEFALFDGEMSLESTAEHMHAIEAESAAIAYDFTAGFWQGALTEEVQFY